MSDKEKHTVRGSDLVDKVKQVILDGDVRRVCLIHEGRHLVDIPLAVGDPAAPATLLEAPVLAALTAFSTLVKECTIEVEKTK